MMNDITKIVLAGVVALTTIVSLTSWSEPEIPIAKENTYPVLTTHGMIDASDDLEQLYDRANLVAEVHIKEQETVRVSPTSVATVSQALVKKVIKGDASLKEIKIAEDGGVLDTATIKGNETRIASNHSLQKQGFVEVAVEGSTVMKPNQKYIVFLYSPNHLGEYTMVGVVQGKIKLNDADQFVATVDQKRMKENKLFLLQSEFAGKNKQEFEAALNKLK